MKSVRSPLKYYLYHAKLVHKFLFLLIVLLLAEIFVSNFYIRNNTSNLLAKEIQATSKQFIEQYTDNVNYRLTKFKLLLDNLGNAGQVGLIFSNPAPTEEDISMVEAQIRQILNNQFPYGLYDLTFYALKYPSSHKSTFIKPLSQEKEEWRIHLENRYFDHFFMHTEGSYSIELLSILKPVYSPDGSEITGVIKLSLFPEKVFRPIKGADGKAVHQLFMIDNRGNYIYGEKFPEMEEYLSFFREKYDIIYNGYPVDDYNGTGGIYLTSSNSAAGFHGVCYLASTSSLESIRQLNRTLLTGNLALMCVTLLIGSILSGSISRRFSAVLSKIKGVSQGNLKISASDPGSDEIGIFDASFTDMVNQVNRLIEQNYVTEIKKKEAEFMALQAQINPHFLFNSLEIINSLIEVEKYQTACEVNARLSDLLRYSINHNSSGIVTLAEEINHMNNYVYIQQIRFEHKFTFETCIDERCLDCHIVKLVFQPFIENSIQHGFRGISSGGLIRFSVRMEGENLLISFEDNGNGMKASEYASLMARLDQGTIADFQEQNESIGILNIHYRLKLKFADAYRLTITTRERQGMCTRLLIPRI
ncbi:MAG: histidine kinase [Lachnospiraceae bacterium]|nr:histidine kinase [Lachnospiraceae bacterium]